MKGVRKSQVGGNNGNNDCYNEAGETKPWNMSSGSQVQAGRSLSLKRYVLKVKL